MTTGTSTRRLDARLTAEDFVRDARVISDANAARVVDGIIDLVRGRAAAANPFGQSPLSMLSQLQQMGRGFGMPRGMQGPMRAPMSSGGYDGYGGGGAGSPSFSDGIQRVSGGGAPQLSPTGAPATTPFVEY